MKCIICNNHAEHILNKKILKKYDVKYYHCKKCGFLFTEKPYWLNEAYKESINDSDTGILKRNKDISNQLTYILLFNNNKNNFLDYAGGYGILVRLMRDKGFNFLWDDPFTRNIFAKGFEYKNQKINLVTSIESFEHFSDPLNEIKKILKISNNVLFTTMLLPKKIPKEWWYYAEDHGQHISFYSLKTLKYIAKKFNLNLCTNYRNIHMFSKKKKNNLIFNFLYYLGFFDKWGLNKLFLKSKTIKDSEYIKKK